MPRLYLVVSFFRIKHRSLYFFSTLIIIFIMVSGCAGPRVRVGDGMVEKPILEATGVRTEQVRAAAAKKELGFWDAYALAVERTERLALSYENLEQARSETQQAIGGYSPHLELNATKGYWAPHQGSSGVSVLLHANQPILTGLNEISALKGASALVQQRKDELRFDAQRLLLDVARSYYLVLQLEESLRTEQSSHDLAMKMLKEQRVFRTQGRIRASDVLSSEAQVASSEADLTSIQDQLEQAREQFAYLTGVSEDQILASQDPADFPDETSDLTALVKQADQRADVQAARENLKVVKAQRLAAVGGFLPVLSAQGDYIVDRQGVAGVNAPKWDAYLSASLPIFTGGQTLGRVREAKSKVRQAELQLEQTLRSAREEIKQSCTAYRNALRERKAYQDALTAAEKSHQAQATDYKLHLTNVIEYLQSLTDLDQARLNEAKSRTQWRIQRVWLGVATGRWPKTSDASTPNVEK
jgi:outer membrane protein